MGHKQVYNIQLYSLLYNGPERGTDLLATHSTAQGLAPFWGCPAQPEIYDVTLRPKMFFSLPDTCDKTHAFGGIAAAAAEAFFQITGVKSKIFGIDSLVGMEGKTVRLQQLDIWIEK